MSTDYERIDLCGQWDFAWTEQPPQDAKSKETGSVAGLCFHTCDVPGNFELDLYKLGKAPEPFFGMNPVEVRMTTEKCHVYYTRKFQCGDSAGNIPFLIFEGLDCFADIFLNGQLIAALDNMLIQYEINVSGMLKSGTNELFIHIRPAVAEAQKYEYPQLVKSQPSNYESLYVRKAPHMYGWDIMPRFVSAGIFRPTYLEYRPVERIDEVYLRTVELTQDQSRARMVMHYKLSIIPNGNYYIKMHMIHGESEVEAESRALCIAGKVRFEVVNPKLWQPKGRGKACLYDVEVSLYKDETLVNYIRFRFGIRTVELIRTPLTTSTGDGEFLFVVNGEKIFAKGTNWVPVDAFHSRDKGRIPAILDMVNDLNCNMVRCWGGNIYEDDLFYEICDRSGILVWQDFSMACGIYPQDDEFSERIAKEAVSVIKRLRHHACIALWSGDNECDEVYNWGDYPGADPNTNIITRKIIADAVRVHDGTRPYICSSPFYDEKTLGNSDYLPEKHLWGPRDYFKSKYYISSLCHFVSEIGYHGCPAPESIEKFISGEKLWPCLNNEEWLLHCTSPVPEAHLYDYRVELMLKQVSELFTEVPNNLQEFSFASQSVQAESLKFFIELFRIGKWRRTGILWWNIMDGWPQFSDAIVDYYFKRKLAYYYIKNSQQDVCVMIDEPESWNQNIVIANDTKDDMTVLCKICDIDSGNVIFEGRFIAYADRSTVVGKIPYTRNKQRFFLIEWEGGASGRNHYLAGQPPFELAQYRLWLNKSGLSVVTISGGGE